MFSSNLSTDPRITPWSTWQSHGTGGATTLCWNCSLLWWWKIDKISITVKFEIGLNDSSLLVKKVHQTSSFGCRLADRACASCEAKSSQSTTRRHVGR